MNFHSGKKHVIDLIFPIALFFVFAVSALVVILLAADSYRSSSNRSEERCQTRICLSYISEKIRQNDDGGNIFSGSPEDRDSLIIRQEIDGIGYTTYIYEYEGMLKELFIRDGVSFLPKMAEI